MDFTTGLADAKNITFDIDYGAVTVVVDSGAAEPTLFCTNLRQDWFTFTNTGDNTSPVRVSYKVPANYNLGKELGPDLSLSCPCRMRIPSVLKGSPSLSLWAMQNLTTAIPSPPTAST